MLYFDSVISLIPERIMAVNLGLHHDFPLWHREHIIFFHLYFIDFPLLPPTFSLCHLLTQPFLLPTRHRGR